MGEYGIGLLVSGKHFNIAALVQSSRKYLIRTEILIHIRKRGSNKVRPTMSGQLGTILGNLLLDLGRAIQPLRNVFRLSPRGRVSRRILARVEDIRLVAVFPRIQPSVTECLACQGSSID